MQNAGLRDRLNQELENFQELEERLSEPEVASDIPRLKDLTRLHNRLSRYIPEVKEFLNCFSELEDLEKIINDPSSDNDIRNFALQEKNSAEQKLKNLRSSVEMLLIPPDPNSGKGVIIEIRAGTGGEEAALFAGDLFRMYLRYAEKKGFRTEMISGYETELGGYKEVIFSVEGDECWDLLHREAGIHRVQRIPKTESGGRIHTSAVTVAVLAEADDEEIEINEKDLKIDVYRASGAGGQHVNKTESAVRILHIPSGIVVACQDERSQHKNKAKAMKVLRARLSEKILEERHVRDAKYKKEQIGSGDRSERVRTYNFPQGRLTDHRIGYTSYNLESIIEGDIDELLDSLLRDEKETKLKKTGV